MPTVPRYNQQVSETATPGIRMNAELSDEAVGLNASKRVGQAVHGAIGTANEIYQAEKKKADDTFIEELDAKARNYKNTLIYGQNIDGNQGDNGVIFRRGENAMGAQAEFGPRYSKYLEQLGSTAKNDYQRTEFQKRKLRHEYDLDDTIMRHTASEAAQQEPKALSASIQSLQADATLNYQTPGAVRGSLLQQQEKIAKFAQNNGLTQDQTKAMIMESWSKTNSGVITRMVDNGQYEQAMAHLQQNEAMMTPDDLHRAKSVLESASVLGESQKNATNIIGKSKSMPEALAEARKLKDPKIQKATVEEIETRYVEQARARKQYEDQIFNSAADHVKNTGQLPPSSLYSKLSVEDQEKINKHYRNKREGIEPVTDWNKYNELMTMAAHPSTRDKFMQTNIIREYGEDLDFGKREKLLELKSKIAIGDERTVKELDGIRTKAEIVNTQLTKLGLTPNPTNKLEAKQANEFRQIVDERVMTFQNDFGRKVTNEDLQKILDNLSTEIITEKGWFSFTDKTKKIYQLSTGDKIVDIDKEQVPRSERVKIEQALKNNGIPVTDDAVKALYLRKLRK